MFTHSYKGAWIHRYCDKDECHVTSLIPGQFKGKTFKSYRAAQIAITKSIKAQKFFKDQS